nr:RNA-directed DNA polymerase, eukaryota [Tanacetum cinerariifolium]
MEKAKSNRYMSDLKTSKISLQSKFDQTSKISKSVIISNFPDDCTNRDLWKVLLSNEGFHNARIVYLGGLWVMIELKSSKTKLKFTQHVGVASWFHRLCNAQSDFAAKERIVWGEMVELEDGYDDLFARKKICIKTSQTENILESFKIIVKGKVFWARAKELFVWSPSFKEVLDKVMCLDDESVKINEEANSLNNGVKESDSEVVLDTYFGDNGEDQGLEHQHGESSNAKEVSNTKEVSSDPFNIYGLLDKRTKEVRTTEEVAIFVDISSSESINNEIKLKEGGSILEILEDMITVGQTMRFSMEGCTKDMEKIIGTQEEQILDLESPISKDEIRTAVYGCGVAKSPRQTVLLSNSFASTGPLLNLILALQWNDFLNMEILLLDATLHVQTAFLPNRQILDGHFIINEILARCKLKKHQAMIFKVDFAKALSLGKASILVNGSLTLEFHFHRGLKQGDPLAPFLFLLIMESLHLSFSRAVEVGIFTGFRVDHSITLSHLFYADDAVFIGMSINIQKSHLLGVGIPDNCVAEAAKSIGCSIMKAPFKYLVILVGDNMSLIKAWDEMISKMKKRLSRWKLNTLSVGVDLPFLNRNFFNGIQDGDRKIAWVKWSKVLASKKYGGLGVSSFYALKRALLFKWVWRYLSHDNSLWPRVISAIHGLNGQVLSAAFNSTWSSIINEVNSLKDKGVDFISH